MSLTLSDEKLYEAVKLLASGSGDLRQRLQDAHRYYLCHLGIYPIADEEIAAEIEAILRQFRPDDEEQRPVETMESDGLRSLAEQIVLAMRHITMRDPHFLYHDRHASRHTGPES